MSSIGSNIPGPSTDSSSGMEDVEELRLTQKKKTNDDITNDEKSMHLQAQLQELQTQLFDVNIDQDPNIFTQDNAEEASVSISQTKKRKREKEEEKTEALADISHLEGMDALLAYSSQSGNQEKFKQAVELLLQDPNQSTKQTPRTPTNGLGRFSPTQQAIIMRISIQALQQYKTDGKITIPGFKNLTIPQNLSPQKIDEITYVLQEKSEEHHVHKKIEILSGIRARNFSTEYAKETLTTQKTEASQESSDLSADQSGRIRDQFNIFESAYTSIIREFVETKGTFTRAQFLTRGREEGDDSVLSIFSLLDKFINVESNENSTEKMNKAVHLMKTAIGSEMESSITYISPLYMNALMKDFNALSAAQHIIEEAEPHAKRLGQFGLTVDPKKLSIETALLATTEGGFTDLSIENCCRRVAKIGIDNPLFTGKEEAPTLDSSFTKNAQQLLLITAILNLLRSIPISNFFEKEKGRTSAIDSLTTLIGHLSDVEDDIKSRMAALGAAPSLKITLDI